MFWGLAVGALVVWAAVMALAAYAARPRERAQRRPRAAAFIIVGGVVVPTVVLAALLGFGLSSLPRLLAPAPPGSLRVSVVGEQWWWRVRYHPPEGEPFELANEIRLPVDEPVEFVLSSPDVIHSFWIPSLAGKMDMIPGRTTRLALHPTRVGTFRGVCAEYCGTAHALMAFPVIVMARAEFEQWVAAQRAAAAEPSDELAARGRDRFFANGCHACHAVRGTAALGVVGPDLTHLGSRRTLGAGIMPNDRDGLVRWIARTGEVKPGVLMPHFGMLPRAELDALAAYLESLR